MKLIHKRICKMQKDYKIYLKFPAVLKDKLLKKEIELP